MNSARYTFNRLVKRYSHGSVEIEQLPERQPDGSMKEHTNNIKLLQGSFAVVPLSQNDISLGDGGVYTTNDRKIYCYKQIKNGAFILHTNGKGETARYRVMSHSDYSDFDTAEVGLYIYMLRRSDND